MEAAALQLNCAHPAEFEFDVQVQGLNPAAVPLVRFVIALPQYSLCFTCSPVSATKWKVTIPVMGDVFTELSYPFSVEVIADGYHFQPAAGTIVLVSSPKVAVGQTRPTAAVAVTQAPVVEPEPEPVPEAPSVTATLLQQVQHEAVEEQVQEAVEAPVIEEPVVEREEPVAPQPIPEAPAKPKLSIFKLKKLGQVTR